VDRLDSLVAQWKTVRPDLHDVEAMAVVARLLLLARAIEDTLGRAAKDHGLQIADGDVLFTLRRQGGKASPTQLSESLLVATGTMTGRLDRLEKHGLIQRVPHPTDRRALTVELTPSGLELVDQAVGEHLQREHDLLAAITAEEREQLTRITRKLLAHLT
jgi:DNA-binding MarR family transcriptional regulator